ncbi:hypothetical protein FGSG_09108 [Fusarium graminearum PH-1]|uniref:Chromosome 4, complete genome n=1 Tax=Gibberella zeae (strain ATCC MYA-4620 / CBS 123657 / FGSC 9075 / NRRL 31084 / PH-1) TaxID=229533 RepID=I1RXN4_GIBZE|nr:hypothetical protein FGSG_09108 [Fusarium graminearum PH-1]ESU15635.1 hypothetical protein FGSG_09108 [Fusarium graminearum PH-1]CEF83742.1 unnamed protein product [Fusarium graminearum]|eukprot:XP_011328681.1 hypothetical protein FGSG_09108 [Fusarium graminearum PH-1]
MSRRAEHHGKLQQPSLNKDIISMVKARDGDKCMITGLQSSFFDPLIVAPIPRIRNSLNRIIMPCYVVPASPMVRRITCSSVALLQSHLLKAISNSSSQKIQIIMFGKSGLVARIDHQS